MIEHLWQDVRHAARTLWRSPGFSVAAILTLAIGIGGSTAIFAFVDGFVLHPFSFPEPSRVVGIGVAFPKLANETAFVEVLSPAEFADIRRAQTMRDVIAFDLGNRDISGGDRPERVFTGLAVTDPFAPFNLRPSLGRGFSANELAPNGPRSAILSHRLWQSRFGGNPAIVGQPIRVNGRPTMVVGVMPPEILILGVDLWLPMAVDLEATPRNQRQLTLLARLAPGATIEQANAELAAIASRTEGQFASQFQEYRGWRLTARPWAETLSSDSRPAALLLLGAVALLLVVACSNIANLLIARSTTRQRETAVRLALGASWSRVARHVVAEATLLSMLGAAAGLLLANAILAATAGLVPPQLSSFGLAAAVTPRVLGWIAIATVGSALLVAVFPALQLLGSTPQVALKAGGHSMVSTARPQRLRHGLIVVEVALSVVLLAGTGLLARSFVNLRQIDPGVDTRGVLTMRLTIPRERYTGEAVTRVFERILEEVGRAPGVRAVSAASQFPPSRAFRAPFRVLGDTPAGPTLPTALFTLASADHFRTLGVPLLRGRPFSGGDRTSGQPVAIVNQAFVTQYLGADNPLDERLVMGTGGPLASPRAIVGVVANTRNQGVMLPALPEVFIPMQQLPEFNQLFLIVRGDEDALSILPSIRQAIAAIDPDQPVYAVRTLEDALAADSFQQRISMILLGAFAAVALALAATGIYGVTAYAVGARTKEIGLRIAVGARRVQVVWLVLRQVLGLAAAGGAIGAVMTLGAAGALRRVVFEVEPSDPWTIIGAVILLGLVAMLTASHPAWRASLVDPARSLRAE